jgi:hypothetical protein
MVQIISLILSDSQSVLVGLSAIGTSALADEFISSLSSTSTESVSVSRMISNYESSMLSDSGIFKEILENVVPRRELTRNVVAGLVGIGSSILAWFGKSRSKTVKGKKREWNVSKGETSTDAKWGES